MLRPITAVIAAALAASAAAYAQSAADKATDAAIACLEIGDPAERLSCLEAATREIKATRIRMETAEESAAADAMGAVIAAEGASEDDLFGAEALASTRRARNEERKTKRLEAAVVEFRVGSLKNITIVLDNGQIWRQTESDRTLVRLPKDELTYTVSIKKSAFGGYWMKINELGREIRVKRLR